ncbi:hypothetical protein DNHGIG_32280 [Collibacillus ludicampi]|jgi:hypothetical protein|uniref:DUF4320 family protein n=1 Tax=Collibacillus ludicampi TaxID=2771369 RepID=A0AAV4LJT5_9BACL|nr:hypothetical protein [Collibacillus ludicampi]GIM47679.1 hypothetical protein DNHGIG_32280 [Collibacillus ludicampi]
MYAGIPFIPWRVLFRVLIIYLMMAVGTMVVKDCYVLSQTMQMARAAAIYQNGIDPNSGQDVARLLAQEISRVVPVDQVTITSGPWAPVPGNVGMRQLVINVNYFDGSYVTTTMMYGAEMPVSSQLFRILGYHQQQPILLPAQFSYYREW